MNNYVGHGVVPILNLNSCAPYGLYLCLSLSLSLYFSVSVSLSLYHNSSMDLSSYLILVGEFFLNWETIKTMFCHCETI